MMESIPKEVLVVEDDGLIRIGAADALVDCGVMAWEASDAAEALRCLDEHPAISLVFTDIEMPGEMNGLDLARQVHEERPQIELILTSGVAKLTAEQIPDHGTFLPKPYPIERLVNIVTAKLDGGD